MIRLLALLLLCLPAAARAADVPAAVAERGALRIAMTPNYPPLEFRDPASNALQGFDIDLGQAIAAKLGLRVDWQETAFPQMLPALATGRVDAVMSGMSDIAGRHEAASFVDYLRSGPQFFVQQSRADTFRTMASLCGKRVGASRRTTFPKDIEAWSDANCGRQPIVVVGTEGSGDARNQLVQRRIDAAVQGNETLPYIMAQQPGQFVPVGEPLSTGLTGIALPKTETGLQQAISGALDALIADGTYQRLLDKWKLSANGVQKATIDAGQ